MMPEFLSSEEAAQLLKLARQALVEGVCEELLNPLNLDSLPERLREDGATFVTLTIQGELRGCIGALEPYQPLAEDVREHAIAAALQDYRFPPVRPDELKDIQIEISYLTLPRPLEYETPADLLRLLRPKVDGVVLRDGYRRSTFLPQVWEKIHDPALFLNYLCQKMGADPELWRRKHLEVLTYTVQEFHE